MFIDHYHCHHQNGWHQIYFILNPLKRFPWCNCGHCRIWIWQILQRVQQQHRLRHYNLGVSDDTLLVFGYYKHKILPTKWWNSTEWNLWLFRKVIPGTCGNYQPNYFCVSETYVEWILHRQLSKWLCVSKLCS